MKLMNQLEQQKLVYESMEHFCITVNYFYVKKKKVNVILNS